MVLDLDPITNKVKIDNIILHFSPYTVYYMLLKHSGDRDDKTINVYFP